MDNLELIDAYLRDEMDSSQKSSFEREMASDPKLKGEFEFQNNVVSGIREARRIELKAMLDKVVVGGGVAESISFGKIAIALFIAGLASWSIYYFSDSTDKGQFMPIAQETENAEDLIIENEAPVEQESQEALNEDLQDQPANNVELQVNELESTDASKKETVTSEPQINRPELISGFEGEGNASDSLLAPGSVSVRAETKEMSSIDVSVDNTKKKFTFHYQFKNGRLFLYGDFSSDLYEILEFNTDGEKALFLFYKGKFYNLNSNNERIIELKTVKSKALVAKLEEARVGN